MDTAIRAQLIESQRKVASVAAREIGKVERETGSYAPRTKPRVEFSYRIATGPPSGDKNSV